MAGLAVRVLINLLNWACFVSDFCSRQRMSMTLKNILSFSAALHNRVGVTAAEFCTESLRDSRAFCQSMMLREERKRVRRSCMNLPRADVHPSVNSFLY